jgi:hypothetical protein
MMMNTTHILAAVRQQKAPQYEALFAAQDDLAIETVCAIGDARDTLASQKAHVDVLMLENQLGDVYTFIDEVRHTYPRLLIILVDEEADFGIPGQADDISTEPFKNDDLANRIRKLISERRVETLRSDSLPAVRVFAKHLRAASGKLGKQQAAVEACLEMSYDYVAYYQLEDSKSPRVTLKAQAGPPAIKSVAPKQAKADDLMAWVATTGQSRIAGPSDHPTHPLVARGRLGAAACVPVMFNQDVFGALVACRDRPDSITQENVLMLELISAQLAAAIMKERG